MKNIREEVIESLKEGFAHQYEFDITVEEFNELEEHREEFSHEIGRTIGDAKITIYDDEGNQGYKILRIDRVLK